MIVLAPHYDDAVLSAWSLLGPDVTVVTVFTDPGTLPLRAGWWDRRCGFATSWDAQHARAREDARAISKSGASWAVLRLPYADERARPTILELAAEIRRYGISEGLLVPLGGAATPHREHVLTREAGAFLRLKGEAVGFYADYPYCAKRLWPSSITGGDPKLDPPWYRNVRRSLGLGAPTVVELKREDATAKGDAMAEYRSQLKMLDSFRGQAGCIKSGRWKIEARWMP